MFSHGSTFGGHPVSAAVALENIAIIEREKLLENVHSLEGHFESVSCGGWPRIIPSSRTCAGMGFFWAVEVRPEKADGTPLEEDDYRKYFKGVLTRKLIENGLLCRFDDKDEPVIQYSPALISDKETLSKIADITDDASRRAGTRARLPELGIGRSRKTRTSSSSGPASPA